MNKFLTALFVLLLVLLVGEVGYLFYSGALKNNQAQTQKTITQIPPTDVPVIASNSAFPTVDLNKNINKDTKDQAIASAQLVQLSYVKNDLLTSAKLTNIYEGGVTEIDTKPGVTQVGSLKYAVKLGIKGSKGNDLHFFFEDKDLKNIKISEKKNGKETPLTFSDLKVNDKITMTETTDLLKGVAVNLISLDIERQ